MSDYDECGRQLGETELQTRLPFQSYVPPRFCPAVDGVLWSRIRPAEEDDGSQSPILSILEFTLMPGVNVHDQSRPPGKLWDAALRYIGSIPGCCAIEWGPRLDRDNPPTGIAYTSILCTLHWDTTAAWRAFQYSLGFTPLVGMLASDVSNCCAKLSASGAPIFGGQRRDGAAVVDVVSVVLDAEDASFPTRRSALEDDWNTLVDLVTKGHDGLRHSYAVWLENNASSFLGPVQAEAAAATRLNHFMAFLAWDGAQYDSHPIEELCGRLRGSLSSSQAPNGPIISRKAVQLISEMPRQEDYHDPPRHPLAPHSLASILKADFPRQCSADLANLREHAQRTLDCSINDARARVRLFPAPRGSFISQGELYEGRMPLIPGRWRRGGYFNRGYHFVDVVWIQLKARAPETQSPHIYTRLKNEIGALPGFVKAFWARDVQDKAKLAVLIGKMRTKNPPAPNSSISSGMFSDVFDLSVVWEDQQARGPALHDYSRILDGLAASSVHLATPLTHQTLTMPRNGMRPWLGNGRVKYLELVCFRVQPGLLERELFEHAYAAFAKFVVFYPEFLSHTSLAYFKGTFAHKRFRLTNVF
jgi:hypothetical protein